MPNPILKRFTVSGAGAFPLDMLRIDQCWPASGGELCTVPELTAFAATFPIGHEDRSVKMAAEVQTHLDRDWNVADHAHPLSSVLSAGRYVAQVNEGWPPAAFPADRPRYE